MKNAFAFLVLVALSPFGSLAQDVVTEPVQGIPRFRLGTEMQFWDRTVSTGTSAGIHLFENYSLSLGVGNQKYSSNDIFVQAARAKLDIDAKWVHLLLRYDKALGSHLGFGFAAGVERLEGEVKYVYQAFTPSATTETEEFENYALVGKPSLYFKGNLFGGASYQLGLNLTLKSLRDETYSIQSGVYPAGMTSAVGLFVDILF